MIEIAGEGALFIDPAAPEHAAQLIAERVLDFPSLQKGLGSKPHSLYNERSHRSLS